MLNQGIKAQTIVAGKWLGNACKLLLLFLPLWLLIFLFFLITRQISTFLLSALGTMAVAYLVFLLIFSGIATGISLLCSTSKQSLLSLFFFWIISCVFIPRITAFLSEKWHPLPSSFAFKTSFEKSQENKYLYGYKGFEHFTKTYEKVKHELMVQYRVTDPDSLPVNVFGFAIESTEEEGQRLFDKSYGELYQVFELQNRIHRYSSLFTPLAAIRFLSMGLSHSGIDHHLHFEAAAENYRRQVMKALNMDIAYHSRPVNYDIKKRTGRANYTRGRDLWASIPDFAYTPLSFQEIIQNHRPDILVLAGWFVVSLVFLYAASLQLKKR